MVKGLIEREAALWVMREAAKAKDDDARDYRADGSEYDADLREAEADGLEAAMRLIRALPASTRYAELERAAREYVAWTGQYGESDADLDNPDPDFRRLYRARRALRIALANLDKANADE